MPYSLHEKSGLASTPLNPEKVLLFRKEFALPRNVRISKHMFLDKSNVELNEARQLLMEALDFSIKQETIKLKEEKEFQAPEKALPEELFPPCIKLILNGLEDGRKRALFILLNYFTSIGWDYDMIEKKLAEWNSKNKPPLREVYLVGQLRYHKQNKKKILPPNCDNEMYMAGIGVDKLCAELHKKGIKNPAQYTLRKAWIMNKENMVKRKQKQQLNENYLNNQANN
jgi:DNA primase large subunit